MVVRQQPDVPSTFASQPELESDPKESRSCSLEAVHLRKLLGKCGKYLANMNISVIALVKETLSVITMSFFRNILSVE